MGTPYRTKLFRSVLGCGYNLDLDEFSEEAQFDDVEKWIREQGYELTRAHHVLERPPERHTVTR